MSDREGNTNNTPQILPPEGASSKVVERMASELRELGFDDAAIHRLIQAAYIGAREAETAGAAPYNRSKRVLVALLKAAGLDDTSALVAATTLCASRHDKAHVRCRQGLRGNQDELHNTQGGTVIVVDSTHGSLITSPSGKNATNVYGIHQILYVTAWRDLNPKIGGYGNVRLPEKF